MRLHRFWSVLVVTVAVLVASSAARAFTSSADQRAEAAREILVMVRVAPEHFRPGASYGSTYGDQLGQSARMHVAREVARKYALKLVGNWPMPMIGVDCFVMAVPDGRSATALAEEISRDSKVKWAQPLALYTTQGGHSGGNGRLYDAQPAASQWHLADLHKISEGRGARIAIVDSGIDARHPDLVGQLLLNRNFVSGRPLVAEQHGTAVAGIIGARGVGIAGIAPGARLLGLRACWEQLGSALTLCDTLSLAKALYFAVETRADVINLSLSGPEDRLLREIIGLALERGQAVVTAFDAKLTRGGFPASVRGVIPVTDANLAAARGEVYIAPGRDVPTTEPGGRWFLVNGSSFAAAHVSGLVALLRERRKSGPVMLVSERSGGGAIDACATLLRVTGPCDCTCTKKRFAAAGERH